jgi:hypothetical protein
MLHYIKYAQDEGPLIPPNNTTNISVSQRIACKNLQIFMFVATIDLESFIEENNAYKMASRSNEGNNKRRRGPPLEVMQFWGMSTLFLIHAAIAC